MVWVMHQEGTELWRSLTEELFLYCGIKPRQLCYAFINTYFPDLRDFLSLMLEYRILLIGKPSYQFAEILKKKCGISHLAAIPLQSFDEINSLLQLASKVEYDMALISAG